MVGTDSQTTASATTAFVQGFKEAHGMVGVTTEQPAIVPESA